MKITVNVIVMQSVIKSHFITSRSPLVGTIYYLDLILIIKKSQYMRRPNFVIFQLDNLGILQGFKASVHIRFLSGPYSIGYKSNAVIIFAILDFPIL